MVVILGMTAQVRGFKGSGFRKEAVAGAWSLTAHNRTGGRMARTMAPAFDDGLNPEP